MKRNEIFQAIHLEINSKIKINASEDSLVVRIMHTCYNLMAARLPVFADKPFNGMKADFLDPTTFDLMTTNGACGSFSMVLAGILQEFKYPVRIAQMKSKGVFAAHNIVEVLTGHGWVVLDPTFDLYFIKPSGELAGFQEISNNWSFFKTQVPAGYNPDYSYEDVRYSNWEKIPVISAVFKKLLDFTIGSAAANAVSVRTFLLRKYNICLDVSFVMFLIVFSFTITCYLRSESFARKNIPASFSKFRKYIRRSVHRGISLLPGLPVDITLPKI